jgi:hypothetical protein
MSWDKANFSYTDIARELFETSSPTQEQRNKAKKMVLMNAYSPPNTISLKCFSAVVNIYFPKGD